MDTLRDCEALSLVLDLLDKHQAKATFFITTGCDRAGMNAVNYLSDPAALLRQRLGKRYGFRNLLLSLFKPLRVEQAVDFNGITGGGHEVGLHGYEHALWIRRFEGMNSEELAESIQTGLEAFEDAARIRPRGFASPGFRVNDKLLLALEDSGFQYSSDLRGSKPFRPVVNGRRIDMVQVPVNLDLEVLVGSMGEAKFIEYMERTLHEDGIMTLYFHASYAYLNPGIIEHVLDLLRASRFLTYREIADEDTAHL